MKKFIVAILALAVQFTLLQAATYQVGCGNDQGGGASNPRGGTGNGTQDNTQAGDPFNAYSANDARPVTDLQLYGGVGEHKLNFTRYTNSRYVGAAQWFGAGSSIRHTYQWDMADYTPSSSGAAQLSITYPDGTQNIFTQVSSTQWNSTAGVGDILYQYGTNYTLQGESGWQYNFATMGSEASHYYQMQNFLDSHHNVYNLSYDTSNRVTQVTEPGGRSLSITYGTASIANSSWSTYAQVPSTPGTGQWVQMSLGSHTAGIRYWWVATGGTGNPIEIAEIQFLDAAGNVLSGTSFGSPASGPTTGAAAAFDGNTTTYAESADTSGPYVGLDLGSTPPTVASIRILARSGYESNLLNAKVRASNVQPASVSVISQVSASDGRTVVYNYQQVVNQGVPFSYATLSSVNYSDGTTSQYGYTQPLHDAAPLCSDFSDPRYRLPFAQIHMDYYSSVAGALQDQVDINGNLITSLTVSNNQAHVPVVVSSTPSGSGANLTYNMGHGVLNSKVDYLGRVTTYTHAPNYGFLTGIKDPLNHTTQYTRTSYGNPATITHPDGSAITIGRDSLDLPTLRTDERGNTTNFTRDSDHRVSGISYPDGGSEGYAYNSFGQVTSHQLRNGTTETSIYSATGLLQSHTDAAGNTSSFTYDGLERPASVTDGNGHTTQYVYNDRGQVTQITYADGSTYGYTYDAFGDKLSETNEIGQTCSYTYDDLKRLTSKTDPLGRTTSYTYAVGTYQNKPLTMTLPSGKTTVYAYDAEWQMTSQTVAYGTPDAATTSYVYDNAGNLISQIDPKGHAWSYTYDSRNRKLTQTDQLGHTTSYSYDANSNVIKVTRPDGGTTTNTYDTMNRLLTSTDPKGEVTTYTYDASGNVVSMKDARGNSYGYTYDALNRKTSMTYPDGSKESYGYDGVGNMVSYTTRASQVETNTYDSRNREVSSTWSDGVTPNVSRSYDPAGRLLSSANGVSTCSYSYDHANQLLSETQNAGIGSGWTVGYTYDADGNRTSLTYPSGQVVNYGYTNRNQLNAVSVGGASLAAYSYDADGNVVSKSLGNGTAASYSYDAANRLLTLNNTLGATSFARFDYGYDSVNRRTYEQRNQASGDTYSYDGVDQVTAVNYDATNPTTGSSGTDRSVGYSYDTVGNRTALTDSVNGNNAYTANADNQYTNVGGSAYAYDANGNMVGGNGLYAYDAQNRLNYAQVTVGGTGTTTGTSTIVQLDYDSKNRMVSRTVNGTTYYFIYDGWNLIEERDASNNVLGTYVDGAKLDEILTRTGSGATVYYHSNALGSVIALTNAAGTTIEKYKYDAFGAPTITDGSGNPLAKSAYGNRFMFTGREYLYSIEIYDYRNREYSAALGRFLQTDPSRFSAGDINIYRYCGNNPLNLMDSLGLCDGYTDYMVGYNPGGGMPVTNEGVVSSNDDTGMNFGVQPLNLNGVEDFSNVTGNPSAPTDRTYFAGLAATDIIGGGGTVEFGVYTDGAALGTYVTYSNWVGQGYQVGAGVMIGSTATDPNGFAGPYRNYNLGPEAGSLSFMTNPVNGQQLGESYSFGLSLGPTGSTTQTNTILSPYQPDPTTTAVETLPLWGSQGGLMITPGGN